MIPIRRSPHLSEFLETASEGLPYEARTFLGREGFYSNGRIYGVAWAQDRLCLKLRNRADWEALLAHGGAEPWMVGTSTMEGWVMLLVPSQGSEILTQWVRRALAQAFRALPEPLTGRTIPPCPASG